MTVAGDKSALRAKMIGLRRGVTTGELELASEAIINRLKSLSEWKDAGVIHSYVSALNGEVDTKPLIQQSISCGKTVVVPVVDFKKKMLTHYHLDSLDSLQESGYGLLEPSVDSVKEWTGDFDLIVTPGLAFDRDGGRLGMGGGYYDRFFTQRSGIRVALALDVQIVEEVPVGVYDEPVDMIITPNEVVRVSQNRS